MSRALLACATHSTQSGNEIVWHGRKISCNCAPIVPLFGESMIIPPATDLREQLRRFLEIHCKTKILTNETGQLSMYIQHAKTQASKPKDKTIVYLLSRIHERLIDRKPDDKDLVVCEFLISELRGFYKELAV